MANREGSAAAGRADSSLALQSEGAGGVGKDPLQGREGSKTDQGVTPSLPASSPPRDLHRWGWEVAPAPVFHPPQGCPWHKALPRLSLCPSCGC